MTLSTGARLGSYEIISPLGAGGMGQVYVGRDPVLDRRIALKVLHDATGTRALERFSREARSASALNHPNIVTIYEFGLGSEPPFIAMELIEGRSLRELMSVSGALPLRQALNIAAQIADALAAAHERGIVHRDLKPENVMIIRDRFVKLLDFGLAKQHLEEPAADDFTFRRSEHHPTAAGTILGTAAYMSPEQARGAEVDYRSDQFSLGILLYEMLTATRPFSRASWPQTLSAVIAEEPEAIAHLNPRIPVPLAWAIHRCLEKNAIDRYESTRDLERELRTIREHLSESPLSTETPPAATNPSPGSRGRRLATAGVAAVLLLAGTVAAWRLWPSAGRTPSAKAGAVQKKELRHLAVFPFTDLTGNDGDAMLGAGLSATVTSKLAEIEDLQVTNALPSTGSVAQRARDLGARLVLSGTMQRSGQQIRVTYSITDAADGKQVAASTLNAMADDLFALQDQLASDVARALDPKHVSRSTPPSARLSGAATQTRYLQALGYLQRYENEASVDGAIRLLDALPRDSALVASALGRAYLSKFKLTREPAWAQRAIEACNEAVALDSSSSEVTVTAGQVLLLQGRLEEAATHFRRALVTRPTDVSAILGLAETLHRQNKVDDAEREYTRAVSLQPDFWGVHNQLGAFYMALGRFEKAAAQFREVRRLTPDNARGLSNLGGAYMQMERWDEAIEALKASLAITPSSSGYANLGTVYYFKGRLPDAAAAYQRAVELTPERFLLWAFLGDALRWMGDRGTEADHAYDRAISLAERELAIDPRNAEVQAQLAACLAKRGRLREAAVHSARSLTLAPDDLGVRKEAALVANLKGNETEAARMLKELIAAGWDRRQIEQDPEFANLVSKQLLK